MDAKGVSKALSLARLGVAARRARRRSLHRGLGDRLLLELLADIFQILAIKLRLLLGI